MRTNLLPLLLIACGDPEGAYPNECRDNIDNDRDGFVDCEDQDCRGSSECSSGGVDPWDTGGLWYDNVQACEDWLDAVSCGEYDFSTSVDCSVYEYTECDITDYFECLVDNTVCDEKTGVPDMSGWGACTEYASCE